MQSIYPRFPYGHNAGWEQPCRMVIYAVETNESHAASRRGRTIHSLRTGVARLLRRTGDDWRVARECNFSCPGEFWNFTGECSHRREPLWLYAFNQSVAFTLVDGWGELESGRLKMEHQGNDYTDKSTGLVRKPRPQMGNLVCDSVPFIVDCWRDSCRIKAIDFLNYVNVSFKELASWCGLREWSTPLPYAPASEWSSHCRQTVEILQSAVLQLMGLWRHRKLGTWRTTAASLALSSFRHITPHSGVVTHGDEPWPKDVPHKYDNWGTGYVLDAKEVSDVERRAYFGGRVYLGFTGDIQAGCRVVPVNRSGYSRSDTAVECGPLTVLDVNGLYPYVMRNLRMPVELMATVRHPDLKTATDLTRDFECIADVSIETNDYQYPVRQDYRVVYPRGKYRTSLAGVELRNALVRGHCRAIENLCVYHVGRPFTEFIDYWWQFRIEAKRRNDKVSAKLAKAVMVSLFGKLGQREPLWKSVRNVNPVVPWGGFLATSPETGQLLRYRSVARHVQQMTGKRDCRHTFTAASACITAYGRNMMDQLRDVCPPKSVVYQDTDSLFVLPDGLRALTDRQLLSDDTLGSLKLQGTYESATIDAPKLYQLDGREVAAGRNSNAIPLDATTYEMVQFQRCGSIITRSPGGVVESWKTLWRSPQLVAPVIVTPSGWCEPIVMR